jgi:hypothetical protein
MELARKLAALEQRIDSQDETIVEILAAIRQLLAPPEPKKKRPIGFIRPEEKWLLKTTTTTDSGRWARPFNFSPTGVHLL